MLLRSGTLGSVSLLALAVAHPAWSQDFIEVTPPSAASDGPVQVQDVVVTGLRGSLRNSKDQLLAPLGDVIIAVNGQRVRDSFDVIRLVATKRPGQTVTLKVWRNRQEVDVKVTLLKRTLQ